MTRSLPAIAVLAIGAMLVVSGCGGGDGSSSGEGGAYGSRGGGATETAAEKSPAPSGASGNGAVAVATNPELGKIVVDAQGFTLYDFHKDKGTESACYGACAAAWPPLTTSGAPKAMAGVTASKLGTTKRKDGTVQITYAGHPLYTYAADTQPGDTNGQDIDSFGAEWYALMPSGAEAED